VTYQPCFSFKLISNISQQEFFFLGCFAMQFDYIQALLGLATANSFIASNAAAQSSLHSRYKPYLTSVSHLQLKASGYAPGEIISIMFSTPHLFQIDPTGDRAPVPLHTFPPPHTCTFGITETTTDMFYIVAGNMSIRDFIPIQGTFSIYELHITNYHTD
jgi:hypothetical protein